MSQTLRSPCLLLVTCLLAGCTATTRDFGSRSDEGTLPPRAALEAQTSPPVEEATAEAIALVPPLVSALTGERRLSDSIDAPLVPNSTLGDEPLSLQDEVVAEPAPALLTAPEVGAREAGDGEERIVETVPIVLAAVPPPAARVPSSLGHGKHDERQERALQDVFFGFDSWQLSELGQQVLTADAVWLRQHAEGRVIIQGHCDDRGTQAYNFVLGEKRARAIYGYLVNLGIDARRLEVVSYGKERPFCTERDEHCRQMNRRGHIVVAGQ